MEFQPVDAPRDHQELHRKDAANQKANGQQKNAVDVPFQEAARATNRQFGDVSAIVFLRSVEHGSHLSPRLHAAAIGRNMSVLLNCPKWSLITTTALDRHSSV